MSLVRPGAICIVLALPAGAQTADPRAVEDCARDGASFVQIDNCLPEAHVGAAMLDAIGDEQFFGEAGRTLGSRCRELNDGRLTASWACASNAIAAAMSLGARLPDGTQIDDPLFEGLNQPGKQEALEAVEAEARALYPDKMFWGGTSYQPLR